MSNRIRTIDDVANAARGRRIDLGLSQAMIADRVGVSRKWVYEFEAGKPGVELGLVLALLDVLGLHLTIGPEEATTDEGVDLDAVLEDYLRP